LAGVDVSIGLIDIVVWQCELIITKTHSEETEISDEAMTTKEATTKQENEPVATGAKHKAKAVAKAEAAKAKSTKATPKSKHVYSFPLRPLDPSFNWASLFG
jgi:hypothetical protein